MHSVLLILGELKSPNIVGNPAWTMFQSRLEGISSKIEDQYALSANVWLIGLPYGMPTFSLLTALAAECQLTYRVLFFQDEPTWVKYSPVEA
jgi:hypothetical protein